jgi:dolichol-phosphate mannosyltransferase
MSALTWAEGIAVEEEREAAPSSPVAHVPRFFVVPAYNEAENLPRLLADLDGRPSLFVGRSRVIVVDDGSDDGTADLAEGYDAQHLDIEVVRLGVNQGPGAAFRAGFAAALAHCPRGQEALVITLEADTTSNLDSLPTMIDEAASADVVLAAWRMTNVSAKRRLLSGAAGFVVRHALGVDAHTVSSFYRVYRASALRAASDHYGANLIRESGFACKAELLAKFAAIRMRVGEVTVDLDTTRRVGESKMPITKTIVAYWRMMARHIAFRQSTQR